MQGDSLRNSSAADFLAQIQKTWHKYQKVGYSIYGPDKPTYGFI